MEEKEIVGAYTPEQIFQQIENDKKRQFDEYLHLDLLFDSRSHNFDKQLFYYDISIILLMLFCIKELLSYSFHQYQYFIVFIPPFIIIFICGWSSIALMRTLNLTMDAFELQKDIIRNRDDDKLQKINDLKIKNKNYNKCAYWSFISACIILFIYFIILTILIINVKNMSSTTKYNPGIVGTQGKSWSETVEKKSLFGTSWSTPQLTTAQQTTTQNTNSQPQSTPQTKTEKK